MDTGYGPYEFQVLCPDGVVVLESRVMGGNLTLDQMQKMREDTIRAAKLLAYATPDTICLIGALVSYMLGVEGEKALLKEIEDQTGCKSAAGGDSVARAFKFLGVRKISLYVPTTDELTKISIKYFEDQGFEVKDCMSLGEESFTNISRYSAGENYANVLKLYRRTPDVDGIFVTGGCIRALEAVALMEKDTGVPVVTTTVANMWRSLQLAGVKDLVYGFGQLLEKPR
jgi:maleate cis-trans isomerase